MTEYSLNDEFIITGIQLSMLHFLTGFDDQATIIIENVLKQKVKEDEQ